MKLQLVFAPSLLMNPDQALASNMSPPLGILYIASYLRGKLPDLDIKVTDGCKIGYKNTLEQIIKYKPDVLGISFYTTLAAGAFKLAQEVNNYLPSTFVIMGGPHATALPQDTLQQSKADIVVVGEGEETFYQIIKILKEAKGNDSLRELPGVWFREIDGHKVLIYKNQPAKFIKQLDDIPFPAWDLIDLSSYTGYFLSKQSPEAPMFFARGCPYHCTFCSNVVWKSSTPPLRLRSPKNIVDEMEYLQDTFGIKEVFDQSDEFNNNYKHALAICQEMKRRKLKITWKAQLRARPFTEELAKEMSEAGCWYVHLGIESGNQDTIDGTKKLIRLEDVEATCTLLKKYNIKVLALFMIYNVWEEDGNLRYEDSAMSMNTFRYAHKLVKNRLVDYVGWSVTTPYPGSKLYEIALRHNLIKPAFLRSWDAWQRQDIFMLNLPNISRKEQAITKLKGEILKFIIIMKTGGFKLKDLPFLFKRATFNIMQVVKKKDKGIDNKNNG
jgi:anaerobic magnesium-protoporphyrin IX monomethyl ester cyclase